MGVRLLRLGLLTTLGPAGRSPIVAAEGTWLGLGLELGSGLGLGSWSGLGLGLGLGLRLGLGSGLGFCHGRRGHRRQRCGDFLA